MMLLNDILSVLGLKSGYMVKLGPLPLGTPSGEGLYLTVQPSSRPNKDAVYPYLSHNTDFINFLL